MSHRGDLLHGGRLTLGINQSHAAGLLGTSQSNVSAYERGRLNPGRVIGERIDSLAVLSPDSIYARYQASTMASTAAHIRSDLSGEGGLTDMLRIAIQAADDFARIELPADRNFFLTEPSPTGSRKWDALLAGLAVHLCRSAGLARTPSWTRDLARTADAVWWVDSDAKANRAALLRDALPSMRARGVILSRRNLESV
jgi:hypothetical protein